MIETLRLSWPSMDRPFGRHRQSVHRSVRPLVDCFAEWSALACFSDTVSVIVDNMSKSRMETLRRTNDPRDSSAVRKSERTRKAILDAALNFLWSKPFRDLTIAELMAQTGVSRSVFYQYFADLHDLMENLLSDLEHEIIQVATPWLTAESDPAAELVKSLSGLVKVCYQRGPILRAVFEAAPMDERLEAAWNQFVGVFDEAVSDRIERDQATGLALEFSARPVAIALNRMDIGTLIHHFGRRPRSKPEPVYQAILQVWISTIYGHDVLARCTKEV